MTTVALPSAAELRGELTAMRLDAPGRKERLETIYVWIFGTLVLGSMAYPAITMVLQPKTCLGRCLPQQDRGWVTLALAFALTGALAIAVRVLGPIGAEPTALTWLHSTPVSRRNLLSPNFFGRLLAFAVAGAVGGLVVGASIPQASPVELTGSSVGGLGMSVLLFAVATSWQAGADRGRPILGWACLLGSVLSCAAPLLDSGVGAPSLATPIWLTVLLALCAAAVLAVVLAIRRLDLIGVQALHRGGAALFAAQASVLMLDPSVGTSAVSSARALRRGRFRSRAGFGRGLLAPLAPELRRLWRDPVVVLLSMLSAAVPVLIGLTSGISVGVLAAGLVAAVVGRSTAAGLTLWSLSPGLQRSLPQEPRLVRGMLMVAPGLVLAIWGSVVGLVLGLPAWAAGPFILAGLSAAVSCARPPDPPNFSMLMTSPMGAMPVGLMGQLFRGFIPALLCVAPMAFTWHLFALVVPLFVFSVVWSMADRAKT